MDNPEYREGFKKVIRKKGISKPKNKINEEKPKIEIKPRQSIMDKLLDVLQQGDKNKNMAIEEEKNQENLGDEELQDKNKLLTYLSLATESEAFQKVFEDIKPEIGTFFNKMFETYKPVINKILDDKENKIKDLALKSSINPSGNKNVNENEKDNGLVEPFNLNNLNDGEKYDEGVVIALAKMYNYLLDQGKLFKGKNDLDKVVKNDSNDGKTKIDSFEQKSKIEKTKEKKLEKESEKEKENPAIQFLKLKNDKLKKYEQPNENVKVSINLMIEI